MASSLNILCLPPELVLEVADHLPPDGILSLKLAHPNFNAMLQLKPRLKRDSWSTCAQLAIRTYLSPPDSNPSHIRCILCKALYPTALFSSSNSPACLPLSKPGTEVVELPERFCAWHVGRLARVVHTGKGGRNEWMSNVKEMCMHCGVVRGWRDCNCNCDSCSVRKVRTYTRYLNNDIECKRFLFWRKDSNEEAGMAATLGERTLFVQESCWSNDATTQQFVINLPVHFEDPEPTPHAPISEHKSSVLSCGQGEWKTGRILQP